MGWTELFRAAVDSIRVHTLRSFLTLLGVIIGVTTIVSVASLLAGLDGHVRNKVILLSPDVFVLTKFGIITSREQFLEAVRRPDLDFRDFELLSAALVRAESVAADVTTAQAVKYRDRRIGDTPLHGTTANYGSIMHVDLEAGRYFSEAEDRAGKNVAVIGWDVSDELFAGLDPLRREISIGRSAFEVIGVVAQQGRTFGQTVDNQVYVPLGSFRRLWGRRNSVDLFVKARGGVAEIGAAEDEARAVLRARRHTGFHEPDPFGVITVEALQTLWRQLSGAAFLLTLLVSGVSLGVGGVVIMNIMLVGVVERTNEIGVRRALGAQKRDIRRQFLVEATLLASTGGLLGIAVATLLVQAISGWLPFPARVTASILVSALGLAALIGVAAGYWPARSASNLAVVDALRDEA